jgi:4-hydroxy-2,2'-bipyrrole-5-carbaldehyde O-methyltransferase
MSLKPLIRLWQEGQLSALAGVSRKLKSFYELTFLAAAGEAGLLNRLASGPANFESLAEFFGADGQGRDALEAWLQMGVQLKLLRLGAHGYTLHGMAEKLARPENDPVLALVEEVAGLHHTLIAGTLPKVRAGELFTCRTRTAS